MESDSASFRENMGEFDKARDSNALEYRWGRLQEAINKFHGCYERLERNKRSGETLEDVKRAALRTYQETTNNQPFKHEQCWEICRENVKWCTQQLTKQDSSKRPKHVIDIYLMSTQHQIKHKLIQVRLLVYQFMGMLMPIQVVLRLRHQMMKGLLVQVMKERLLKIKKEGRLHKMEWPMF